MLFPRFSLVAFPRSHFIVVAVSASLWYLVPLLKNSCIEDLHSLYFSNFNKFRRSFRTVASCSTTHPMCVTPLA